MLLGRVGPPSSNHASDTIGKGERAVESRESNREKLVGSPLINRAAADDHSCHAGRVEACRKIYIGRNGEKGGGGRRRGAG